MKTCELLSEYEDTGENLDILWQNKTQLQSISA